MLFRGGWLAPPSRRSLLTVSLEQRHHNRDVCGWGGVAIPRPDRGGELHESGRHDHVVADGVGPGSPALPGLMMDSAYNVTQTVAGTGGTMVIQAVGDGSDGERRAVPRGPWRHATGGDHGVQCF